MITFQTFKWYTRWPRWPRTCDPKSGALRMQSFCGPFFATAASAAVFVVVVAAAVDGDTNTQS
jgi:hypothetical protein